MLNVIQIGVGSLGLDIAQTILEKKHLNLVGAVDENPDLQGADLGYLATGRENDVKVSASLEKAITSSDVSPKVALISTVSEAKQMAETIKEASWYCVDIVTTCEELSYPWNQHPETSAYIDEVCRSQGITCLPTGVNPGFLMDYLPAVLSSVCQTVSYVEVERVQNAAERRESFQRKIGAGLTHEEFEEARSSGSLRHIGLPESVDMIAAALGITLDKNEEQLDKIVAAEYINSGYKPIEKGMPSGVEQIAIGKINGQTLISLKFRAAMGEEASYDKITINGKPSLENKFYSGVHGDLATAAIATNAINTAYKAESGLKTMLDVPVISCME